MPRLATKIRQQQSHRQRGKLQSAADRAFIKIQQRIESAIEPGVETAAPGAILRLFGLVPRPVLRGSVPGGHGLQKPGAEQRNHRHRDHERRQQRQAERERQRGKQKLADAEEQRDGEKVHHIDQRGGQHRQVHFGAALLRPQRPATIPFPNAGKCFRARSPSCR